MIEIPTKCPCCDSELERVKDQLFCRNSECGATAQKKILNYCKKRKIKGLAEKSIEKLELTKIVDIYELTEAHLVEVLGKNGTKIYKEIQESLNTTIDELIGSLSIPLVGRTTAKKLRGDAIDNIDFRDLPDKARANFAKWCCSTEFEELEEIPFNITESKPQIEQTKGSICITGSFKGYNRTSLKELAEQKGYKVTTTVTKNTTLLLADKPSNSSKHKKAEELNIKIIYNIEEL